MTQDTKNEEQPAREQPRRQPERADPATVGTPLAAADEGERLSLADHLAYSQQLYGQPSWVLKGVISANNLNQTQHHAVPKLRSMVDAFLKTPNARFQEGQ